MNGKLILVSGPSGVGKDTFINHYISTIGKRNISKLISTTTRFPRKNKNISEKEGIDYYFRDINFFRSNEFLEQEEVYRGSHYGTLLEPVIEGLKKEKLMIKDIDIIGSNKAKKSLKEKGLEKHLIQIAILPSSIKILKEQLELRDGKIDEERIDKANYEINLIKQSIPIYHQFTNFGALNQAKEDFETFRSLVINNFQ